MKVGEDLTRVSIRPTGVESKKSMGALKMELVKPEKNDLDALSPKRTANSDLKNTKTALSNDIRV